MNTSALAGVGRAAVIAALAMVYGCGAGKPSAAGTAGIGAGGSGGTKMADSGTAGTDDQSTAGTSGTDASGMTGDTAGVDGQSAAGSGGGGTGDTAGTAGDSAGGGAGAPITWIVPTKGCGQDPGQPTLMAVRHTIQTAGTKAESCADSTCGAWSYLREYFVTLPVNYDSSRAYPLVLEGPGCGGTGINLSKVPEFASMVIRVGLTPPPNAIGHSTNPGQGCFDDHEGDDSVDWVFYEDLYDALAAQLCFDKNRVFAAGHASSAGGGWWANELGCKYAGDPARPVRGVLADNGSLPTDPRFAPTCSNKPMAGIWSFEKGFQAVSSNRVAITRAMQVNGCTIGTGFDDASFEPFPIGPDDLTENLSPGDANPATICRRITGCPDLTPLVVCALPGNNLGLHANVVGPAWPVFIKLFGEPPLR